MELSKEIKEAAEFLQYHANNLKFGEITVIIKCNEGRPKFIDKIVSEKTLVEGK